MSSIRVRSYLDENAPQFDGQDKRAFIKFMKAMFESPSYNARVVSTITVNQTDKTISIPTTTKAGFSTGNLLKITGTLSPAFQTTYYKVIEASDTKLILSISNYSTVAYPASDMFNCTLQKTAQSLVIGGVSYNSTITPTLGNLFYTPSTIKVEVRKKGTPVKNSKVYLLDMNMICVGQTTTDDNGIAYFFNRPSEYLYTVISEDSKGEYVSTVVSRLKGDV